MQPDDIRHVHTLDDPRLHPDGRRVVFTVSHPDLDEDHTDSRLWVWDGQQARAFTHGPHDSRPRWSPDGRHLAFLRREPGDDTHRQVMVMPADGGEARAVTDFPLGAGEAEWSPDSRHLAVTGSEWIDALAGLDADERARRPRRHTTFPYREDDRGWVGDRRTHVHVVAHDGSDSRRLTDGDFRDGTVSWHPDGTAVAFLAARHPRAGLEATSQPLAVDVADGRVRELGPPGMWDWVGHAPDGTVLLGGLRDPMDWPDPLRYWRLDDGEPVDLHPRVDRDTMGLAPPVPLAVADGMLVGLVDRGTVRLVGLPGPDVDDVDPEELHEVVAGNVVVTAATASPDATVDGSAGVVYAVVADPGCPGELERVVDGRRERLTDYNAALADVGLCPVERFPVVRDGVELDAWAVLPDGDGPWPVLLNIHGGPTAEYDDAFFDEFQVYASAGHLVVGTNPRGSSGRGRDWCRAVVGAWTDPDSVDMLDLRAVVDTALERFDGADPDRIGIMGGSYGGFSTARIIARDHRFSSAVVERGLLAWTSFGGTSDIGPFFDRMFLQATLPDDWEALRAASPIALAGDVTTPTLVVHSQEDWRCPVEQAEQYWVALLRAGVETEFVRFPGEGHELSRSGSPKHRVERFGAILDWHARHLGGVPSAGDAAGDATGDAAGEGARGQEPSGADEGEAPPDPERASTAPGVG